MFTDNHTSFLQWQQFPTMRNLIYTYGILCFLLARIHFVWQILQIHGLCSAERSRVPDSVLDPDLLSADAVEDHFVMEPGSYEEVQQHSKQCQSAQFPLRKLISCIGFAPCRTRLQACSCRAGPCARLAAASLTSSPAWVTLCPAVTPATPVIAASSMPSVTAAK